MKSLFVIALLCASLSSFSQIQGTLVKGCGYAFQTFAITAGVAAAQTVIATSQDHPIIVNPQVTQKSDGSWCWSFVVVTFIPEPLPSPLPKLISKEQIGCAPIPYVDKNY